MENPEQLPNEEQNFDKKPKNDPHKKRGKKITPEQKEEEKKKILDESRQAAEKAFADENLDKHNEKFDLSQYRKHNPNSLFLRANPKIWKLKFPIEYYLLICKLKDWPERYAYDRPGVVGRWTNIFIYKRFPFGILQELEQKNEADSNGHRPYKHHQFMTDSGELELEKFLDAVIKLMRKSPSWIEFKRLFAKEMGLPYQGSFFDED